ncbi:MAG TPA: 3,4-dihydroxy-2-butanone-4-phosphate synthase, partial [Acetobacteraceae bacterium]|nr:3,4-dihydroxy-2-butanone-4-phosphate synthase [Acetobacteraceae bacterium]
ISAEDRALTLRAAGDPGAGITSLKSPGHVLPAMTSNNGGVANQALAVLRRLTAHDVAAWTDILDDDGELASAAWCAALAERLGIPCVDLADLHAEAAIP